MMHMQKEKRKERRKEQKRCLQRMEEGFDCENRQCRLMQIWEQLIPANASVPDRLFKRHRRWRSEYAKDGYIKDDLKALLSVSLALGI